MDRLDYAHGESARNNADDWPSHRFFVITLVLALVPQVVGIGIVVLAALTRNQVFVFYGLSWLAIGGCITLLAFVAAMVYRAAVGGNRPDSRDNRFKARVLLTLSLTNLPVAVGCFVVGLNVAL